jgi:TonB family protein
MAQNMINFMKLTIGGFIMKKTNQIKLNVIIALTILSTSFVLAKEPIKLNFDPTVSDKEVFNMIENYNNLEYEFGETTLSGKQNITVKGLGTETLESIHIFLINQQNTTDNLVVKNEKDEYLISERNSRPKRSYNYIESVIFHNLKYPDVARQLNISAKVHVLFLVDENGKVEKVISDVSGKGNLYGTENDLKSNAERAVLATSDMWRPAAVNGEPVKKWMYVPIRFNYESRGIF